MKKHKNKNRKKPWPTKDAMQQIYEKNLWGGEGTAFYSGSGSHNPDLVQPYVRKVNTFLHSFDEPLSVCDLGCGDFNVGRQLVPNTSRYTAIDVVPELIERNKRIFSEQNVEFLCIDIAKDALPQGDCAILRNVLQHLSNAEIQQIVSKLTDYRFLILTEHLPEGSFTPNKDIISGQGIRLKKGSGVDLLSSPFELKITKKVEWLSLPDQKWGGVMKTVLYRM